MPTSPPRWSEIRNPVAFALNRGYSASEPSSDAIAAEPAPQAVGAFEQNHVAPPTAGVRFGTPAVDSTGKWSVEPTTARMTSLAVDCIVYCGSEPDTSVPVTAVTADTPRASSHDTVHDCTVPHARGT